MSPKHPALVCLLLCAFSMGSCAHAYIEGTQVRDTAENREVFTLLAKVRDALEQRDANALLALVSLKYFEDMGTADPKDDYGYTELKDRLLKESMDAAKEVYLSFELHEVVVREPYAYADVRYFERTRLELPSGRLWDTHRDFDRLEMVREEGAWRIISGL